MRLASDPITIAVDGVSATLRPSLRAAYHLQRRHGFPALITAVIEGDLSRIADMISFGSTDESALPAFLREIEQRGAMRIDLIRPALFTFIGALIGRDENDDAPTSGKTITFEEHFTSLFEIGTGWLGWTPEATWNATPGEIIAAQRGLIAKLKAVHGSADEKPAYDPREDVSESEVLSGIAALKANARRGKH